MTSDTASRRESYHHGDLRRTLLEAAGRLLEESGAGALSLREAARLSGVSRTAPYRHFPDKESLLAALATEGFHQLSESWRRACAAGYDAEERMHIVAWDYVSFARDNPARFRLMFGDVIQDKEAHPELQAAARETYGLLQEAVAERLSQPDAEGCNVNLGAIGSWVIVHGVANLLIDNKLQGLDTAEVQTQLVRALSGIFFTGLGTLTRDGCDSLHVPECGPDIRDGREPPHPHSGQN